MDQRKLEGLAVELLRTNTVFIYTTSVYKV
jgi:hypothetical protein